MTGIRKEIIINLNVSIIKRNIKIDLNKCMVLYSNILKKLSMNRVNNVLTGLGELITLYLNV